MLLYCVLALSIIPTEDVIRSEVDRIVVHHCYDDEGKHVFDQVVFYNWVPLDKAYRVVAWRMLKDRSQYPVYDRVSRRYVTVWFDGWELRRVTAITADEWWTTHDPEVEDRKQLPKELRVGLPVLRRIPQPWLR